VAYDLDEQENLAELKAWWGKYGTLATTVVVAISLAFLGNSLWGKYQDDRAFKASALYESLQKAIATKDTAKVREAAAELIDTYGGSAYAGMAALRAARANVESGDLKTARAQLQWASEHAHDDSDRLLARLRLGGLLIDEGSYDDALKILSNDIPPEFEAAFADRRGDLYFVQNKIEDARREYKLAYDKADSRSNYQRMIQFKLDGLSIPVALGNTAPAPAAAAATSSTTAATPAAATSAADSAPAKPATGSK